MLRSPSSRRAWIEILQLAAALRAEVVALLAEGVDRNFPVCAATVFTGRVALLAEGVDRNSPVSCGTLIRTCRPPRGGRG